MRKHTDSTGQLRSDLWRKGVEDTKKMKVADTISLAPAGAPATAAFPVARVQWTQIGPAPMRVDANQIFQGAGPDSGEVVDIAIDPRGTTDRTIYIASNDGGIWKSTDGGLTWAPKTDRMPSLSMGSVALDPGNPSVVYAGTGNLFDGGSFFFKAVGIYKSLDGGETWAVLNPGGIFNNVGINRMVLPSSGVLLAGSGLFNRCGGGAGSGLYRSVDGGQNFGSNSPQFNDGNPILNGCISDLDLDTANSSTVYASVSGQGVFVSTDGGATFISNLLTNNGGPPAGSYRSVIFSQSRQPNNQTMYVLVQSNATPRRANLFRSTDTGANWTYMPDATARSAENNGCQCGYDLTLGVDPQDANRVYIGFQELYRSTDGGANFGTPAVSQNLIHWDHHAMAFSPPSHSTAAPTRIWVGTDGGIHSSTDGGTTWLNLNETIATTLVFALDIGRGNAFNRQFSYAGTWDTGTVEHRPDHAALDWHQAADGDGGPVTVDPTNPLRAYGTWNGTIIITANGGNNWAFGAAASDLPVGGLGEPRFAVDPNNNSIVYAKVGANLYQSVNLGVNFTLIRTFPSQVQDLANVGLDSNILWVGLANGNVQYTTNALAGTTATWIARTVTGKPAGQAVADLAINALNTDEVVVVYPGFSGINPPNRTKHVFRTTDSGVSWTDISGTDGGDPTYNLPDLPLHAVVIDASTIPQAIIVASDASVMRTLDGGATWQVFGVGLPTVDCLALEIDPSVSPALLRVGTYGRSVFELTPLTDAPVITIPSDVVFSDTCVGTTNFSTLYVCNTGTADLSVGRITSTDPQFTVVTPSSGYPVVISPDFCFPFRVRFAPTSAGDKQTTFIIPSNDPASPTNTARGYGKGLIADIAVFIANAGNFGEVCIGSFKDLNLTINNPGGCPLLISNITSSSPQFIVPVVLNYPLLVHPGDSIAVPIRFQPTALGPQSGSVVVITTDDAVPNRLVPVNGQVPPGDVRVTGSTDFGEVCAGTLAEKTISVCNVGKCNLTVTSVAFNPPCADFTLINNPFPAVVSHDSCVDVVIRYTPTSCGAKQCRLVITTDDPDTPVITLIVTATTPCASIDVPPDMAFPPTVISSFGPCRSVLPFPISNTGTCPLWIVNVQIGGPQAAEYSLVGLPSFPIILEQGHIVGDGDLGIAFSPAAMARERHATITVTYIIDPVAGTTASITRELCGEGVSTGGRVLVMQGNIPVPKVEKIQLQRINANRNKDPLDTHDVIQDATLVTIVPGLPCEAFQYHREYGTVSNPIQLLPGSYQVTVSAIINGKRKSRTVGFDVETCTFNPQIVIKY